jgi:hypothetical protein
VSGMRMDVVNMLPASMVVAGMLTRYRVLP